MQDAFHPIDFLDYLRARWRIPAVACAIALVVALAGSLALPKRYTATAVLVIEPPGGYDARNAMAVSPVYLESLKTYERFASSDTLLARAAGRFHLQDSRGRPSLESLKQRMLAVSKPRDTKLLEIEVTLNDPARAQSVAQFLAEETVRMNRDGNAAADRDLLAQAEAQAAESARKLQEAQAASAGFAARAPLAAMQSAVARAADSLVELKPAAVEAEADAAGLEAESRQSADSFAAERLPQVRARAAALNRRVEELSHTIDENTVRIARGAAEKQRIDTSLAMAETAYQAAAARLRDVRAAIGTRSERLRVLDPGVVPQRPSWPNLPANLIGAVLLALIASAAGLSLAFGYRRKTPGLRPVVPRERSA